MSHNQRIIRNHIAHKLPFVSHALRGERHPRGPCNDLDTGWLHEEDRSLLCNMLAVADVYVVWSGKRHEATPIAWSPLDDERNVWTVPDVSYDNEGGTTRRQNQVEDAIKSAGHTMKLV